MKAKKHVFVLTVATSGSQSSARNAVLVAFGSRLPDGCSFHLVAHSVFARRRRKAIMRSVEESRRRMATLTSEERQALEVRAREIIKRGCE